MLRFIVRESYYGHVVHAGGYPEFKTSTIDNDIKKLESFLLFGDVGGKDKWPDYVRELIGVEILEDEC